MSARPTNLLSARSTSPAFNDDPHSGGARKAELLTLGVQIFGTASPLAPAVATILQTTGFGVASAWDADALCAGRFAREYRIPSHASNIDTVILQEKPLLNIVLAPPHYQAEIIIKSLSLDKHVLFMPPSTLDMHEAMRALRAAQYAPDLIASPLFVLRTLPGIARVREMLANDELGRVLAVEASVVGGRFLPFDCGGGVANSYSSNLCKWHWDKRMLGASLDTVMCHIVDLITCLAAAANGRQDGIGCRIGRVTCSSVELDSVLKQQPRNNVSGENGGALQNDFNFYCRPNTECLVMSHMLSQNLATQFLMSLNFLYPDRPFELSVHVSCARGRVRIRSENMQHSNTFNGCLGGGDGDDKSASLLGAGRLAEGPVIHANLDSPNDSKHVTADVAPSNHETSNHNVANNLQQQLLREAASYKVLVEKYDSVSGSCIDESNFDLIPTSLFSSNVKHKSDNISHGSNDGSSGPTPVPPSSTVTQTTNGKQEPLFHALPGSGTLDRLSRGQRRSVDGAHNNMGANENACAAAYDSFYCSALMLGGLRATLEQVKRQLLLCSYAGNDEQHDFAVGCAGSLVQQFPLPTLLDGVYTMQVVNALRASCDQHDRWQTVALPAAILAGDGGENPSTFSYINNAVNADGNRT